MRRNPILCAVSPVSQNLCGQYLNDFYIFLAGKYASFGHSAYCRNHYGRLSHLREKYGKSPPKILSIFTSRQHKFWPNGFFFVHMYQHNGNYRMIAFCWYVHCIGILLSWHANDVMFLGCQANFGTQKNYATGTFGPELAYRLRVAQPTLMDVPIFLIYFYVTIYVCVPHFYDLSVLVGCCSSVSIRGIIYKFLNVCPFDRLHGCCG